MTPLWLFSENIQTVWEEPKRGERWCFWSKPCGEQGQRKNWWKFTKRHCTYVITMQTTRFDDCFHFSSSLLSPACRSVMEAPFLFLSDLHIGQIVEVSGNLTIYVAWLGSFFFWACLQEFLFTSEQVLLHRNVPVLSWIRIITILQGLWGVTGLYDCKTSVMEAFFIFIYFKDRDGSCSLYLWGIVCVCPYMVVGWWGSGFLIA